MNKLTAGSLFFLDQIIVHVARLSAYIYLHDPQDVQKMYATFILLSMNAVRMPLKFYWLQKAQNLLPDGKGVPAPQIKDSLAAATETRPLLQRKKKMERFKIETGLDYVVCGSPIFISFAMLVCAFTLQFSAQSDEYTQVCVGISVLFKLWDEGRNIKLSRDFINDVKGQEKFTNINYRHKMHRGFFTAQTSFTFLECFSFVFGGIYALSTGAAHYRFYLAALICCCLSFALGLASAKISTQSYNLLAENLSPTSSR